MDWYVSGLKKHQTHEYDTIQKLMEKHYYKLNICDNNMFITFGSNNDSVPNMRHPGERMEIANNQYIYYVELNDNIDIKNDIVIINNLIPHVRVDFIYALVLALGEILSVHYSKYTHCINNYNEIKFSPNRTLERDIVCTIDISLSSYFSYLLCREDFSDAQLNKLKMSMITSYDVTEAFLTKKKAVTSMTIPDAIANELVIKIFCHGIDAIEQNGKYDPVRLALINNLMQSIKLMCTKVSNCQKLDKQVYNSMWNSYKNIYNMVDKNIQANMKLSLSLSTLAALK